MNKELIKLYVEWLLADESLSDSVPWEKIHHITKNGIIFGSEEYEKAEIMLQKIKNSLLFKALNE